VYGNPARTGINGVIQKFTHNSSRPVDGGASGELGGG
jgi:hypothetical protein